MEQSTQALLIQGIETLKNGDTATAHQLFLQVASQSPDYQAIWLWLSDTAATDDARRAYLKRCLEQDTSSRSGQIAQKKLDRLERTPPVTEMVASVGREAPPLQAEREPMPRRVPQSVWMAAASVILAVLLFGSIGIVLNEESNERLIEPAAEETAREIAADPSNAYPALSTTAQPSPYPIAQYPAPVMPSSQYPAPTASDTFASGGYPIPTAPPLTTTVVQTMTEPMVPVPVVTTTMPTPTGIAVLADAPPTDTTGPAPEASVATPTRDVAQVPAYPQPLPDGLALSQGIGMERAAWEQQHGAAEEITTNIFQYEAGNLLVWFANDSVWKLERRFSPLPIEEARDLGRQFLPQDSELVNTYESEARAGMLVDVYRSPWLGARFPDWFSTDPGTLNVLYNSSDQGVETLTISVGDNP